MRPPAKKCTVRIVGKKGEVRLSPDLCFSKRFQVSKMRHGPGPCGGSLTLQASKTGLRVYYTNERARSGRISLGMWLRRLGFSLEKIASRTFAVVRVGRNFTIDLSLDN